MRERGSGTPKRGQPPEECANCGAAIPRDAHSCPECGADERTGWRETSVYDNVDLPEEVFDDGARPRLVHRVNNIAWYWWCIAVAVLLLIGAKWLALF